MLLVDFLCCFAYIIRFKLQLGAYPVGQCEQAL
jgi:hypothetical protein